MTVKQIQHLLEDPTCAEILGKYGVTGVYGWEEIT